MEAERSEMEGVTSSLQLCHAIYSPSGSIAVRGTE